MASPSSSPSHSQNLTLQKTITSTIALTSHLISTLRSPSFPSPPTTSTRTSPTTSPGPILSASPSHSPSPLSLATTSSTLLRAHTTKLALLSLTPPFTPSAICPIFSDLSTTALPSLVAAAQSCSPSTHGSFLAATLRAKVLSLLTALEKLLLEIPRSPAEQADRAKSEGRRVADARAVGSVGLVGSSGGGGKQDAMRGTGMVWGLCDEIIALGEKGLVWAAERRMGEWKALVADAVEELEGWVEEGAGDGGMDALREELAGAKIAEGCGGEEGDEDGDAGSVLSELSSLDGLVGDGGGGGGPAPHMRPLATQSVAVLKHVALLYPPLMKRRIRRFPVDAKASTKTDKMPSQEQLGRLDEILELGRKVSEGVDALAESLYKGEKEEVLEKLGAMVGDARRGVEGAKATWAGGGDEFSEWVGKWEMKLEEVAAGL